MIRDQDGVAFGDDGLGAVVGDGDLNSVRRHAARDGEAVRGVDGGIGPDARLRAGSDGVGDVGGFETEEVKNLGIIDEENYILFT